MAREDENAHLEARALRVLDNLALHANQATHAEALYQQSLTICHAADLVIERAYAQVNLAYTQLTLGRHAQSRDSYQRAVILLSEIGDQRRLIIAYFGLGAFYEAVGHHALATEQFRHSLPIL